MQRWLERFPAKWIPVRVKKTRQNKKLEPRSDSIGTKRALAGILAIFNVANGLVMLFAGSLWWDHVAGARETGPFNPHFVQDVGAAFAVAGLALAARAWRGEYWPAAVAGAGFLAAHGLIHLAMIAGGHDHHAAEDLIAVIVPAALALYTAFPNRRERQGQSGEPQHA